MRTEHCTHPAGVVTSANAMTDHEAREVMERLSAGVAAGGRLELIIDYGAHGLSYETIECSWCENPEAVARRAKAFAQPRRRWWRR
jgi:hypothetical protein